MFCGICLTKPVPELYHRLNALAKRYLGMSLKFALDEWEQRLPTKCKYKPKRPPATGGGFEKSQFKE
jgi:hypothetical protein